MVSSSRDSIEVIADIVYQLPLTIISEILDIPEDVSIHNSWQSMTQLIGNPPERVPGQMISRTAQIDMDVGEHRFPAGTRVTCLLGSANRDPAVFSDPDRFDIRRDNARSHLAFSSGVHFCLGASLSRMEVAIFLESFSRRFPEAGLVDDAVEWLPNSSLLGLKELHVRFRCAARR